MGSKLPAVDPAHKPTWSDGRADPPPASLEAALSRKPYRPLATPEHSHAFRLGLPLALSVATSRAAPFGEGSVRERCSVSAGTPTTSAVTG